jgi:hypothetical protein
MCNWLHPCLYGVLPVHCVASVAYGPQPHGAWQLLIWEGCSYLCCSAGLAALGAGCEASCLCSACVVLCRLHQVLFLLQWIYIWWQGFAGSCHLFHTISQNMLLTRAVLD